MRAAIAVALAIAAIVLLSGCTSEETQWHQLQDALHENCQEQGGGGWRVCIAA